MNIGKSIDRVVSLLLALTFIFTNTAYSAETKLRVPLQLQTEAGQKRVQETMDAAKPGVESEKLASNTTVKQIAIKLLKSKGKTLAPIVKAYTEFQGIYNRWMQEESALRMFMITVSSEDLNGKLDKYLDTVRVLLEKAFGDRLPHDIGVKLAELDQDIEIAKQESQLLVYTYRLDLAIDAFNRMHTSNQKLFTALIRLSGLQVDEIVSRDYKLASNTGIMSNDIQGLFENINGEVAKQPVILAERPEVLTQAMKSSAEGKKLASNEALQRATKAMRIPVIGGNWKMDKTVATRSGAEGLLRIIIEKINMNGTNGAEIIVAVPIAFLGHLHDVLMEEIDKERLFAGENASLKGKIKIAAQNIAGVESGAQTGRSSVLQVKDLGATHVIIGHSEQVRDGSNEINNTEYHAINEKVRLAITNGLVPIVCVGENLAERERGNTKPQIQFMVENALKGLIPEQVDNIIIAYEPVWAINTGKTATPEQAEEILQFIRGLILDMFGEKTASKVRIIYGGSVKPDNIAGLMDKSVVPDNDGALVGGASLKADSFMSVVKGVPVKLASNQTADNINVKIEHATLMAEEGIQNPEGFKRLISQLLDNPVTPIAVAVIAGSLEEIDTLKAALTPADFDTLKGRGVKFSALDVAAINDAKAMHPDNLNIQEGFEVFSITANLRDYDRLIQTIDQGV